MFLFVMVALDARYLARYFGEYNRLPRTSHAYHADLLEAAYWLRPRQARNEKVYVTTRGMSGLFAVTLVGPAHDPRQWFRESCEWARLGDWDACLRYGRMRFLYGDDRPGHIEAEQADAVQTPLLFIARPGELGLQRPSHVICGPDGRGALWFCEVGI